MNLFRKFVNQNQHKKDMNLGITRKMSANAADVINFQTIFCNFSDCSNEMDLMIILLKVKLNGVLYITFL